MVDPMTEEMGDKPKVVTACHPVLVPHGPTIGPQCKRRRTCLSLNVSIWTHEGTKMDPKWEA